MENASKALIMAATVLLGLMIISIGVTLFTTFSEFSRTTLEKVEDTKIAEWNNQFLKYYGQISTYNPDTDRYTTSDIKVTAHDIITVANLAKQNNINYELQNESGYNENMYYVQVKVIGAYNNLEKASEQQKNDFLKTKSLTANNEETKYYKCSKVEVSKVTKKVMYIEFQEI